MKTYRVFIQIEVEDEEENFQTVYDDCIGLFSTSDEAHALVEKIEQEVL